MASSGLEPPAGTMPSGLRKLLQLPCSERKLGFCSRGGPFCYLSPSRVHTKQDLSTPWHQEVGRDLQPPFPRLTLARTLGAHTACSAVEVSAMISQHWGAQSRQAFGSTSGSCPLPVVSPWGSWPCAPPTPQTALWAGEMWRQTVPKGTPSAARLKTVRPSLLEGEADQGCGVAQPRFPQTQGTPEQW